ncbi:uncharacterized protein IAS62_000410 [Cryptococcus decagattii]|uniref:Uncharacterized protein n=1 Tax=Cryptococcus decagattii TaxID=1859122 RepID=A0ABZ2AL42_9TREE
MSYPPARGRHIYYSRKHRLRHIGKRTTRLLILIPTIHLFPLSGLLLAKTSTVTTATQSHTANDQLRLTNSTSHRNVLCPEHFYLLANELSLALAFMLGTHILLHRRDHQKQILRKL